MRGKGFRVGRDLSVIGITPAYAGKSRCFDVNFHARRDHPRVCGEKYRNGIVAKLLEGSPPRMRGKD